MLQMKDLDEKVWMFLENWNSGSNHDLGREMEEHRKTDSVVERQRNPHGISKQI